MNPELQKQYANELRDAVSETMEPRPPPFERDLHRGVLDALEPLIQEIAALKAESTSTATDTVYTCLAITIGGQVSWRIIGPSLGILPTHFHKEQDAKNAAHLANMAYKAGWDNALKRAAQPIDIVSSVTAYRKNCANCKYSYICLYGDHDQFMKLHCKKFTATCNEARSCGAMCDNGKEWKPK